LKRIKKELYETKIDLTNQSVGNLLILAYDEDKVGKDDKMGHIKLPLTELYPSSGEISMDLKDFDDNKKKVAQGSIVFRITEA